MAAFRGSAAYKSFTERWKLSFYFTLCFQVHVAQCHPLHQQQLPLTFTAAVLRSELLRCAEGIMLRAITCAGDSRQLGGGCVSGIAPAGGAGPTGWQHPLPAAGTHPGPAQVPAEVGRLQAVS